MSYRIVPIPFLGRGSRISHVTDRPGQICELHHHLYHELDYVLDGRGMFSIGGRKVDVKAGDMVYLASGVHHWRTSTQKHPLELCTFTVDDPTMRPILDATPGAEHVEWPWWRHWAADDLHDDRSRAFLGALVRRMRRQLGPQPATAVARLLPDLAGLLAAGRSREPAGPDLFGLAQRVRQSPHRKIGLDAEAARLGISPWWLSRLFRRRFGVGLWEHRDYARIDCAIVRLLSTDIGVRDLGRALGFSSPSQFIATFRRLAGLTPLQFRLHHLLRLSASPGSRPGTPRCGAGKAKEKE